MSYNWSMWKNGISVVYRRQRKVKSSDLWRFVNPPLFMRLRKHDLQVTFSHQFKKGETIEFALSFPWTYHQD